MRCQERCPRNKAKLRYEALPESFTLDESGIILEDDGAKKREDPVWDRIRAKLASDGLPGFDDALSRNLRALVAAKQAVRRP